MIQQTTTRTRSLYRLYDADDQLLYVGVAHSFLGRLRQHEDGQPWWNEAVRVTVEHYGSSAQALEAERVAIQTDRPRYNVFHNRSYAGPKRKLGRPPLSENGETVRIAIRLSPDLKRRFEEKCRANGISPSDRLRQFMERDVKKP